MKNQVLDVLSVTVGLLMVSGPIYAHHSDSVNDMNRVVTVTGTVTRFDFTNPHERIYLDAKDANGNAEQWIATGGGPSAMRRIGWNKGTFKPGDQLTITGFPFQDGRKIMLHVKIVRGSGEEVPSSDGEKGRLDRLLARQGNRQDK
jgi:hypothetical protein